MESVQHVFLVGAKSLGAYGGYETFIDKLTEYHQGDSRLQYHVACKANGDGCMDPYKTEGAVVTDELEFTYHGAYCFRIPIPEKLGVAQAIYYDLASLKKVCKIIKEKEIKNPIVYIMACRVGPFIKKYYRKIHKLGGKIFLNPDGHEWMRAKWSAPVRKYWKLSERMMVKYSDLCICDSIHIEKYIHNSYDGKGIRKTNPRTTFIAYGAEMRESNLSDNDTKYLGWLEENKLKNREYYLVVGRFVPENNYKTIIREFMKCHSTKKLVFVTNVNDKFFNQLEERLHFESDDRIKFVGTVYNQELLMKIRENAYGYIHGHEVGGTNPSLLEALASTKINLLLDVDFNKEVAEESALYWDKKEGSLAKLIDRVDTMSSDMIEQMGDKAKARIVDSYSWEFICGRYAEQFLDLNE